MHSKPLVIGIGEFLWDVLPTGRKAGGAPVNFAYHASQNGVEGWAVSAVGNDDAGRDLLAVTASYGIRTLVATVDKPTGTVDVSLCNGQPTYTIHEHVAWDYIPLTEKMLSLACGAGAICFGTLAQRGEVSHRTTCCHGRSRTGRSLSYIRYQPASAFLFAGVDRPIAPDGERIENK